MEKNLIIVEAEKLSLEPETKKSLIDKFSHYFEEAAKLEKEINLINVERDDQIDEMAKAKTIGKKLQRVRLDVEEERISSKAQSLRKGKAIDGFANIIKFLIVSSEERAKKQANFISIKKENVLLEITQDRTEQLLKYDADISGYNLKEMNEKVFKDIVFTHKTNYDNKIKWEKEEEAKRIKKEKEEKAEQDRIKKENEDLKKEAAERDRLAVIEKEKQAKIQEQHEAQLKKEAAERERVELELKKKEEAEQKLKDEQEAQEQVELKNQRDKALAPDKDKLNELASTIINIIMPEVEDDKAKKIIENVIDLLGKTNDYIKKQIINL